MNDRLLRDAFVAHEHLTPDADLALDGIQQGIHTRRRTRVAVAGAVVAVAAVATAVPLGLSGRHHGATTHTTAAAHPPTRVADMPPLGADYLTIAAGWLPSGRVDPPSLANGFAGQERDYDLATTDGLHLSVRLTYKNGLLDEDHGTATTVNGNRGTKTASETGCIIDFAMPYRTLAQVEVEPQSAVYRKGNDGRLHADPSGVSAERFADLCRRVAEGMQFDRHDPIGADYRPTYTPPGTIIRDITRQDSGGKNLTLYTLAAADGVIVPSAIDLELNEIPFSWHQYTHGKKDSQPPLRTIHGYRVYSNGSSKRPGLFIDSIRPGVSLWIGTPEGPALSLKELYKVVDGLKFS